MRISASSNRWNIRCRRGVVQFSRVCKWTRGGAECCAITARPRGKSVARKRAKCQKTLTLVFVCRVVSTPAPKSRRPLEIISSPGQLKSKFRCCRERDDENLASVAHSFGSLVIGANCRLISWPSVPLAQPVGRHFWRARAVRIQRSRPRTKRKCTDTPEAICCVSAGGRSSICSLSPAAHSLIMAYLLSCAPDVRTRFASLPRGGATTKINKWALTLHFL